MTRTRTRHEYKILVDCGPLLWALALGTHTQEAHSWDVARRHDEGYVTVVIFQKQRLPSAPAGLPLELRCPPDSPLDISYRHLAFRSSATFLLSNSRCSHSARTPQDTP